MTSNPSNAYQPEPPAPTPDETGLSTQRNGMVGPEAPVADGLVKEFLAYLYYYSRPTDSFSIPGVNNESDFYTAQVVLGAAVLRSLERVGDAVREEVLGRVRSLAEENPELAERFREELVKPEMLEVQRDAPPSGEQLALNHSTVPTLGYGGYSLFG